MDKQTALAEIDKKISGLEAHKYRKRETTPEMSVQERRYVALEHAYAGYWPSREELNGEISRLQEARKDVLQRTQ